MWSHPTCLSDLHTTWRHASHISVGRKQMCVLMVVLSLTSRFVAQAQGKILAKPGRAGRDWTHMVIYLGTYLASYNSS